MPSWDPKAPFEQVTFTEGGLPGGEGGVNLVYDEIDDALYGFGFAHDDRDDDDVEAFLQKRTLFSLARFRWRERANKNAKAKQTKNAKSTRFDSRFRYCNIAPRLGDEWLIRVRSCVIR